MLPTVVVARRPAPGQERQFERWLWRLDAAARRAPGYLESAVQPPDATHPGEWVIVYQFATPAELRGWLESPVRRDLMEAGAGLVDGSAREQVLALAARPEPVTAVSSFQVHPGHEDEFDDFQQRLDAAVARWPGFLRAERFEPVRGVQDETVVVFSFDTREHLDAWLHSDERRDLLAAADRHVAGDRTVNVVGGFGGWFESAGGQVKRWKQMLVVLLALVPTSLGLTWLRLHLVPDLVWPVAGVISNVIGVVLLTWVLMPALTRLFGGWLRR